MDQERFKQKKEELAVKSDAKLFKEELDSAENRIKAIISDIKPKVTLEHVFHLHEIQEAIKQLEMVKKDLKNIAIPKEIEIARTSKIQFDDKTRLFLLYWCGISSLVTAVCIYFAVSTYQRNDELNRIEQEKGIFVGRNQIYNISTPAGKKRLDNLYPDWNKKIK
jgi:hypothetical protein